MKQAISLLLIINLVCSNAFALVVNGPLKGASLESAAADPTGVTGRVYFNTGISKPKFYNGSAWSLFGDGDLKADGTVALSSDWNVGAHSITASSFVGALTGNADTATSATTATTAGNVSGTVAIANGGTGQTTAGAALNALLPTQTGNASKALVTDGTNTSWGTVSGGSGLDNAVTNPSAAVDTSGWTLYDVPGGDEASFLRNADSAATKINGIASFMFAPGGEGDYVETAALTLANEITGDCEASISIYGDASPYRISLRDASSELLGVTGISSIGAYHKYRLGNYLCGGAGVYKIRITAGAGAGIIYFGAVRWGSATNIGSVQTAGFIGSAYLARSTCAVSVTSTTLASMGTNAACPGPTVEFNPGPGVIQTTDVDAVKFTVNNLGPGYYKVRMGGDAIYSASTAIMSFGISDGATTSGSFTGGPNSASGRQAFITEGTFYYSSAGNKTFELFASSDGGSVTLDNNNNLNARVWFSIERFPTQSETVARMDLSALNWSGTSSLTGTTASATYADPGSISGAITQKTSTGLTCTAASSLVGITCTLPEVGVYEVCYAGRVVNTGSGANIYVKLTDGANNDITGEQGSSFYTATATHPIGACGHYSAASVGAATFKIRMSAPSGGTGAVYPTSFTVKAINKSFPMPLLVGGVTSNSSGMEYTNRAAITTACTTGSCAIASQSGSWLSSVTWNSTGNYTANIVAGMYSAAPTCFVFTDQLSATMLTTTTTAFNFTLYTTGPTLANGKFNIQCTGPR